MLIMGAFAQAHPVSAESKTDGELFAYARQSLGEGVSSNDLALALTRGLWNSNRTAVAISVTNSPAPSAWVFLKRSNNGYLAVDLSTDGLGIGLIGNAARSAYERLELVPIEWLPREDGMLMVVMRTRAWKGGQRYTVSKPILIRQDGTLLRQ